MTRAAHPSVPRPGVVVLAIGTATGVGKTWVGAGTLDILRHQGVTVAARKPAQSFATDDPEPTDAEVLAGATGEHPSQVCPPHRNYPVPMAPPMAAEELGLPLPTLAELVDELHWPNPTPELGWVETVGGPRSPIAHDGDAVDLCEQLDPDVTVLVADAGLGTVNAVIVSAAPFENRHLVVILNRFDPADILHRRNLEWLRTRQGLRVVTDPEALAAELRSS